MTLKVEGVVNGIVMETGSKPAAYPIGCRHGPPSPVGKSNKTVSNELVLHGGPMVRIHLQQRVTSELVLWRCLRSPPPSNARGNALSRGGRSGCGSVPSMVHNDGLPPL